MSTRAKIILFSVLGVLVVAAVAVTTVVLVIHQNHKNDVAAADRVAADYLDELATFRRDQGDAIVEVAGDDYVESLDAIAEAMETVPSIGDAPEYGRENSDDYQEAAKAKDEVTDDLAALEVMVQDASDSEEFIDAVAVALDRGKPAELLGPGPFASGQPVRDATIPAMQAIKDTFEAVEVPDGYEEAAELTSAAVQHVLDNLNQMAASLDGGQSYFFEFTEQYSAAEGAVTDAQVGQLDDLIDAAEAFGAGEDLDAPSGGGDEDEGTRDEEPSDEETQS